MQTLEKNSEKPNVVRAIYFARVIFAITPDFYTKLIEISLSLQHAKILVNKIILVFKKQQISEKNAPVIACLQE